MSLRSTSSLVTMCVPSGTRPGRLFTRLPVARITSVASSSRSPPAPGVPSSPASATRTVVAFSRTPCPRTNSTWFFLTRLIRPLVRRSTTCVRRRAIAPMSTPVSPTLSPNVAASRMRAYRSADSSIALVGMQPQWRQVPPIRASSTRAVRRPIWAARNAAEYPPVPPPRTTRSNELDDPTATVSARSCAMGERRGCPRCRGIPRQMSGMDHVGDGTGVPGQAQPIPGVASVDRVRRGHARLMRGGPRPTGRGRARPA